MKKTILGILLILSLFQNNAQAIIVGFGNTVASGGTSVSDDFNRSNANPIGGNWSTH